MSPGNDRGRPGESGPNVENKLNDRTSVAQSATGQVDGAPPLAAWAVDPLRLSRSEHEAWLAGHGDGYAAGVAVERRRGGYDDGFAAGWQARVEQEHLAWQAMAASIKRTGGPFAGLRFSELAELRGEREAAERARVREQLLLHRVHREAS